MRVIKIMTLSLDNQTPPVKLLQCCTCKCTKKIKTENHVIFVTPSNEQVLIAISQKVSFHTHSLESEITSDDENNQSSLTPDKAKTLNICPNWNFNVWIRCKRTLENLSCSLIACSRFHRIPNVCVLTTATSQDWIKELKWPSVDFFHSESHRLGMPSQGRYRHAKW